MAETPWIDGLTLGQVLAKTVERCGDNDALVFPWLFYRRSYAEFLADVRETARALMGSGTERGEHIGIWATNWPQWVVLQFAAAQVGAVLVNINPAYRAQELEYVLNQADITTLFLTDRFKSSDYFGIFAEVCPELSGFDLSPAPSPTSGKGKEAVLGSRRCPKLRRVISIKDEKSPGMLNWPEFIGKGANVSENDIRRRQAEVQPEDVVSIQYTSGTTGFPKGAMLTHRNLLLNAFYVGQRLGFSVRTGEPANQRSGDGGAPESPSPRLAGSPFRSGERVCIPVPFYHCFGCVLGTLVCAVYGAAMVIPAESFDPFATLKTIQDEHCTTLYGVPTMFIAQLNHPRFAEFNLRSLRTGIMAGSPCPIEVMRKVVSDMGAKEITIAYGLTEASPIITQSEVSDSLEHRVGTVGRKLPGLEVRIVRPGTVEALPSGQPGELMVRGHCVMKGYYNKPKETAEAITSDGWLHSGDLAMETADGYFRITGRIKDMIIRGGENIYPREIEEFLYTHPQIADVQVVGLPDPQYGEEVCAWIRLKAGTIMSEEDVKSFCRDQIAYYKVPRYVVFVDEYPCTVTGKVQKFKLREMGIERFGLQKAAQVETA